MCNRAEAGWRGVAKPTKTLTMTDETFTQLKLLRDLWPHIANRGKDDNPLTQIISLKVKSLLRTRDMTANSKKLDTILQI